MLFKCRQALAKTMAITAITHDMNNTNARHYKVADQIQKDLVVLIRKQIKDPALSPMLTIEEVRVSKDLGQAKVYFSTLDDKGEHSATILNNAAGYLRAQLFKLLKMRSVPHLEFIYDTTSQQANHISDLIDSAISADAAQKNRNLKD